MADTQIIELQGKYRLIQEILADGLEIAEPARDRGIDLIAFAEMNRRVPRFTARPIQLKAYTNMGFGVDKKYARIADVVVAYVWNVDGVGEPLTYGISYPDAVGVAEAMGWTKTLSWERGKYITSKPSKKLLALLEPYRMKPGDWWRLVVGG